MDLMLRPLWRRMGSSLATRRIVFLDSLLTQMITSQYCTFAACGSPSSFMWHQLLQSYVEGTVGDRPEKTMWFRDIDTVYTPMNWGNKHWVGMVIHLQTWHIEILDPLIRSTSDRKVCSLMTPLAKMLPYLIKASCNTDAVPHFGDTPFSISRLQGLPQNERTGDCGPFAIKLMEMHSQGALVEESSGITDSMVDRFRMQYAMDVYEECIAKISV